VATPHHPANQVFVGVLLAGEFAHQILGVLNPVRFGTRPSSTEALKASHRMSKS
jgi:hypothetical protein